MAEIMRCRGSGLSLPLRFDDVADTIRVAGDSKRPEASLQTGVMQLDSLNLDTPPFPSDLVTQGLLNVSPLQVFWKDADLRYLGCNIAFARMAGLASPKDVLGLFDRDLPWTVEQAEAYRRHDGQILETGASLPSVKLKQRGADGITRHVLLSEVPLRDGDDRIQGVLGTFEDITELRQTQDQLQRIQTALDDAGDAICVVREDGHVSYVNMAFTEIFHRTREMVNTEGGTALFQDSDMWDAIQRCVHAGEAWGGELVMVSRRHGPFPAELRATPVIDDSAVIIGMLLMINDITQRKAMESKALHARKMESIGNLAAGIAHEINTPAQYVGDNIQYLQKAFARIQESVDAYEEFLEAAEAQSWGEDLVAALRDRLRKAKLSRTSEEIPDAINDALEGIQAISRIVAAMKEFSHPGVEGRTATNLNRSLESTASIARNEWKYVADMVLELDESLPEIPCFAGELNQVFLNIMINAAHAISDQVDAGTYQKGNITLTTRVEDDWVEVRIADDGGGIPEDIRPCIFDPFFTTKDVGKGTGQGLGIAHRIITEQHGGTIDFESVTGQGTVFIIRLPIDPPLDDSAEELSAQEAGGAA